MLTKDIPIVFCNVTDPVALGFAKSLGRPGGNLTGLSTFVLAIAGKRLQLLHDIMPGLKRLACWYNPGSTIPAKQRRSRPPPAGSPPNSSP